MNCYPMGVGAEGRMAGNVVVTVAQRQCFRDVWGDGVKWEQAATGR